MGQNYRSIGIKDAVVRIIESIGEDPKREGLSATPDRVERLYKNFFYGYKKELKIMDETERNNNKDSKIIPITTFNAENQELLIRNTKFISFCEHHIVPFSGTVFIGIIPNKKLLGMNKIDRIVKYFGARLQIQERMTSQIVNWIWENLKPLGVMVVIKGDHYCARLQGDDGEFTTSSIKGVFVDKPEVRVEFLTHIK